MTIKGFCRFVLAYVAATLAVATLSLAIAEVFKGLGLTFWPAFVGLWSITVGLMSVSWTMHKLGATLGQRETPILRVSSSGWRSIPIIGEVGAVLTDADLSVLPMPQGRGVPTIDVPEVWALECGPYLFPETDVSDVLKRGWKRQRNGKAPFARSHWLGKWPFYGDRKNWTLAILG